MIRNLTKKTIISRRPVSAVRFFQRGFGMIGKKFQDFDAMIFYNCSAIHTMFMSSKIDVIFLDKENKVCEVRKALEAWHFYVSAPGATTVIELPCGTIDASNTEPGDVLDLNAELTPEEQKKILNKGIIVPDTVISISAEMRR